ncbi:PREDICTED: LOW QUALITY PROTEIN: ras-associating and dilute domain-containing protein-like [Branchiostoma belcheri]|uniref:LOW QUALITY PROTEIN: ras-associating and dilute domain-containing protein-like n=1 Tax=Branchiostoma belcheri TaxID=7741 RepID=A0A6P4XDV6_BRABE|nr:PREDICTED: LOW QUALITY PROTEIN: ras-associating and dilute domain-containing protein-like [Branchiostoma belcheri]
MATETILTPGVEGLFQRKPSSAAILSDPRVLAHLQQLHDTAQANGHLLGHDDAPDRDTLPETVANYNRRNPMEAFKVVLKNKTEYEGALRFYYEDGEREVTKAVRVRNTTTVEDLVPILEEKFNLGPASDGEGRVLFQVQEGDAILLDGEERPLEIAVSVRSTPRFVLRNKGSWRQEVVAQIYCCTPASRRRLVQHYGIEAEFEEYCRQQLKRHSGSSEGSSRSGDGRVLKSPRRRNKHFLKGVSVSWESRAAKDEDDGWRVRGRQWKSFGGKSSGGKLRKSSSLPSLCEALELFDSTHSLAGHVMNGSPGNHSAGGSSLSSANTSFGSGRHDDSMVGSPEVTGVRQPSKNRARKSLGKTKSVSQIFQRGLSLRGKKKEGSPSELSTDMTAPGVLKVFGAMIEQGANYKSVLATRGSTARELVKEALERYSIDRDTHADYVLCDVIGRLRDPRPDEITHHSPGKKGKNEEKIWEEECVRVIGDNEKPLEIQSLWKPETGYFRRFEMRRREEIHLLQCDEVDTVTAGINAQARRISRGRSRTVGEDELSRDLKDIGNSLELNSRLDDSHDQEPEETESSQGTTSAYSVRPPVDFPFLLTIRGCNPEQDLLLYLLSEPVAMVGRGGEVGGPERGPGDQGTETEGSATPEPVKVDILLSGQDILPQHCWLCRKAADSIGSEPVRQVVTAEPLRGARLTVNGVPVYTRVELNPGDLVALGEHYVFLFKDPTSGAPEIPRELKWLTGRESAEPDYIPVSHSVQTSIVDEKSLPPAPKLIPEEPPPPNQELTSPHEKPELKPAPNQRVLDWQADRARLKLCYLPGKEDELLEYVTTMVTMEGPGYKLSPAYLMCACVEYSAMMGDQTTTRKLLLKISSLVQSIAWERTKEISNRPGDRPSDPIQATDELLPLLKPIVFWMSNSLEMLAFLQAHLPEYLSAPPAHLPPNTRASVAVATEEVLSFVPQTLYIALPTVLDSNPFAEDEKLSETPEAGRISDKPSSQTVDAITYVLQSTWSILQDCHLHDQMTSQMFAYLFFFMNASLFNTLMERGAGGRFYKWQKGVQIRGNLDQLEGWAADTGLAEEAGKFMAKLSAAVDLLATPKVHLLQSDWASLRRDFPALNAAQLQQVLGEYQLGPGRPRPRGWFPPPEEVESALKTADILESFNNHPPLVLPISGFQLDLAAPPSQPSFRQYHDAVLRLFGELQATKAVPNVQQKPAVADPGLQILVSHQEALLKPSATSTPLKVSSVDPPGTQGTFTARAVYISDDDSLHEGVAGGDLSGVKEDPQNYVEVNEDVEVTLSSSGLRVLPVSEATSLATIAEHDVTQPNGARPEGIVDETPRGKPDDESSGNQNGSSRKSSVVGLLEGIRREDDGQDEVFVVDLGRGPTGLGLGLIDGLYTPLKSPGIYVRTLVPNGPAHKDGRLRLGDRILAVNGTSLVGADYQRAMLLIRNAGEQLRFLVAKSDSSVAMKITASSC